ncbi:MAG: DUF3352 domain-containing protein [Bacteroidota bacterium]|nr:MAG: DUF3352 domain-containing protein [Bacteroidota bacterium]
MERKVLILGIILTICVSILIGILVIYSGTKTEANPLKLIPQDAAYILKLNGFGIASQLDQEEIVVWNDLCTIEAFERIDHELFLLDSLIDENGKFGKHVTSNTLYVSGHFSGSNKVHHLVLLSLPYNLSEREVRQYLHHNQSKLISDFSERRYEGKTIYSISLTNKRVIALAQINGFLAYSNSPVIIEDAIRQSTRNESLLDKPDFEKITSTSGLNKQANLYIDFSQAGKIFSLISHSNLSEAAKKYKNLGLWASLDLNIKNNLLMLNGFSQNQEGNENLIGMVSQGRPVPITIDKVLPASTGSFLAFGISEAEKSYRNYMVYLKACGKYDTYQANLANMNSKYGLDFEQFFLKIIDNELGVASVNFKSDAPAINYLVLKCKSGSEAEKELQHLTEKISQINPEAGVQTYSPDNILQFPVYKIPITPLFGRILGNFFQLAEECYMVLLDNYLVVAPSHDEASQFVYQYVLQKTLANDEIYRDFADNLTIHSYMLGYINVSRSNHYFSKQLSPEFNQKWAQLRSDLNSVQAFGFQMSEVSKLPYLNVFIKHFANYRGKPKTIWESLLDTTHSSKPVFVVNHLTNQNEIFVQDDKHSIYLLNQAGRILWKQPLNEKINSEIVQIDFYKNKKLQIVFSTENYLHIIDRNGNYLEKYPVKLREKATAGVSVFDYEGSKEYRFFIPCADRKIYAYTKEGTLIPGWKFNGVDHPIEQSIRHFRIENKDFIVCADNHRVYMLDRQGNERVQTSVAVQKSANNDIYLHDGGSLQASYLVTTLKNGTIVKIYFDGRTEQQSFDEFSEKHHFDYKDVNADGKNDYIFLDNNSLQVFDHQGKSLFRKDFKSEITEKPVYYHFSYTNRKIGLVSVKDEKIFLVNNNGELYKDFPLEGRTLFSIGYFDVSTNSFNLIVGGRNNFLYNYAVE